MRQRSLTLSAVIHREGKIYVADCPELGTVSQGPTVEEALANLREATELYLDSTGATTDGEPALLTTFTIERVVAEAS